MEGGTVSEQDDAAQRWWKDTQHKMLGGSRWRQAPLTWLVAFRAGWDAGRQAQHGALLEALEAAYTKAPAVQPRDWDGDCCRGNYDDAHCHGIDLGRWLMVQDIKAAIAEGRSS